MNVVEVIQFANSSIGKLERRYVAFVAAGLFHQDKAKFRNKYVVYNIEEMQLGLKITENLVGAEQSHWYDGVWIDGLLD